MHRVMVTGMGVLSSLGNDLNQHRHALIHGATGIGPLVHFKSKFGNKLPFAEVAYRTEALRQMLQLDNKGRSRTHYLAHYAFQQAILDANISEQMLRDSRTALIVASTVGGMCLTDELYRDANIVNPSSKYLEIYDCASVAIDMQETYQIGGIINTINTACSSSANAIHFGARLLKRGLADTVICGGVDSLAKFTINGFNALGILSNEACRPFDHARKGLNLGEAAAFLVLQKEQDVQRAHAVFTGAGNSNDAYHASSLSPTGDGPYLAMEAALSDAGIDSSQIDYINAHGTGTENNDLVESEAMTRLFGEVPYFASSKSITGHTLGAAGALEAVFCIMALQNQELYPSISWAAPIAETKIVPLVSYQRAAITHVMSNSFGFGGNCSSLVFSKAILQ